MVQLKVNSVSSFNERKTIKKRWGPSLSDCLEIHATIKNGVANKGTWKFVSSYYSSIKHRYFRNTHLPFAESVDRGKSPIFYSNTVRSCHWPKFPVFLS